MGFFVAAFFVAVGFFAAGGLAAGGLAAGLFITVTAFQGEMSRVTVRHSVHMHVWGRL